MGYLDNKGLEHYSWLVRNKLAKNQQMTKSAGAVAFCPAPETELEPIVDFMFTETLPDEGEKGPNNPSTITGVSSVALTRANSNLIRWPYYRSSGYELSDVIWTINDDGSVSATGTASDVSTFALQNTANVQQNGILLQPGTYKLSGCPANGSYSKWGLHITISSVDSDKISYVNDYGSGSIITVTSALKACFYLRIASGNVVSNLTFYPALQLIKAPFEKNEQDVYTLDLDGTYYGGSIDLKTGLMTVTWIGKILDGTESITKTAGYVNVGRFSIANVFEPNQIEANSSTNQFCTHYIYSGSGSDSSRNNFYAARGSGSVVIFSAANESRDDFASWLAQQYSNGTPIKIVCKLATPYIVQLTPTQILSLPQSDPYVPQINTVYSDQQSIQVGWVREADLPVRASGTSVERMLSERFADVVNVRDFGAKGDGVTDDGPAIQTALDAAGFVYFPEGTYVSRQQLYVSSNTYIFGGNDAEIVFTRQYSEYSGIHARGSVLDTVYTLTDNVVRGTRVIPLDSVSDFSAGDTVIIADNRPNLTSESPEVVSVSRGYNGEIHKIESVDAENSTITLYEGIWSEDFTTTRNAFVCKIITKKNITIEGISVKSAAESQSVGVGLYCVENFFVKSVYVEGFYHAGVTAGLSFNGTIDSCRFKNIIDDDLSLGYSIVLFGSQFVVTRSCTAELCGKLWDTGVGKWVDSNETEQRYVNTRFVTCRDSSITSPLRCGISTHEPTEYVTIDNNFISAQNTQESQAILCRSNNATIINNTIIYGGKSLQNAQTDGVVLYTRGKAGSVKISGNKIVSCIGNSINVIISEANSDGYQGDTTYTPSSVIISDNYLEPATFQSDVLPAPISIDGTRVDGDGCVLVTGNTVYRKTNSGSQGGITVSGQLKDVTISNNVIHGKRCIYVNDKSISKPGITTSINIVNVFNNYLADDASGAIQLEDATTVKKFVAFGNVVKPPYDSAAITSNLPDKSITYNIKEKNNALSMEGSITGSIALNGEEVAGKQYVYPVGTIYKSTVATSPDNASIVGFGTWTALPDEVIDGATFHSWYRTA